MTKKERIYALNEKHVQSSLGRWSQTNGMDTRTATDMLQCCENYLYFQEEEWNTGYCRFHHIYVVKNFDCPRFEPIDTESKEISIK